MPLQLRQPRFRLFTYGPLRHKTGDPPSRSPCWRLDRDRDLSTECAMSLTTT